MRGITVIVVENVYSYVTCSYVRTFHDQNLLCTSALLWVYTFSTTISVRNIYLDWDSTYRYIGKHYETIGFSDLFFLTPDMESETPRAR